MPNKNLTPARAVFANRDSQKPQPARPVITDRASKKKNVTPARAVVTGRAQQKPHPS